MKRRFAFFLLLVLVLVPCCLSFGLDLGVEVWSGNLLFRTDRAQTDVSFPGADYLWGCSLYIAQPISESFSFETGFYSDPILRNISYTMFQYEENILSIGVGPFFGFFNDLSTILKSGISTSVKVELPGIAYVKFRSDSSIGGELVEVGSYSQEKTEVSLGVYVPNAICSANVNQRKFTQKHESNTVIDSLTEYSFDMDIFQKNAPYHILLSLGYQTLIKSFVTDAATVNHTLNSVVIGTELDFTVQEVATFKVMLDSNVYTFGQGVLVGSSSDFLFRASMGVELNMDKIIQASRKPSL